MGPRGALGVVLALALVLGAGGLRWGLPSEFGWAPDEVLPADVDAAVAQRFAWMAPNIRPSTSRCSRPQASPSASPTDWRDGTQRACTTRA
jgi:hypothetical protein